MTSLESPTLSVASPASPTYPPPSVTSNADIVLEATATAIANSWDDIDVAPDLLRGIYAYGFDNPSPVQANAIPVILGGKDIIAQAQSGTGKTGAFAVAALEIAQRQKLMQQPRSMLADKLTVLILSPTRELATQSAAVITAIGANLPAIKVACFIGGERRTRGDAAANIASGCPGRVYDMLQRRQLDVSGLKLLIIDEADEMLSLGFQEQVQDIFGYLPKDMQVALFSATLPESVLSITGKFMRDPVRLLMKAEMLTLEGIKQYYVAAENDDQKYAALKDLFGAISMSQCIIYSNSVQRVSMLAESMQRDKFPVCCIHSNMSKEERDEAFQKFKHGECRVLISTDVTARGIDIQQVSVVINFDVPRDVCTYLHRIGRSGRYGRRGTAINFVTKRDMGQLQDIERYYATQIAELPASFVTA
jgi:superfamily II DNA/RNA helicase